MKKKIAISLTAFAAVIFVCGEGYLAMPGIARTEAASLQNGANMSPSSSTDFGSASFDQSLKDLAGTGANYVTLNIPLYQTNVSTTDVQDDWNTPTPGSLTDAISYAHSLGLGVMLKFDVFPGDNKWSGDINPANRNGWFDNYLSAITPFVQIAQKNGVEEICIGDELVDMSADGANPTNTSHWLSLIAAVRKMYSGKLTYGANWGGPGYADETDSIAFWSALDYIGISAYYNLTGDGSVSALTDSWSSWNAQDISALHSKWNKPLLFTEIGYEAIQDSYTHPWMWWETGTPDEAQQANDYQALLHYWDGQPDFAGEMLWEWSTNPNAGGPNDDGYTPQGKTAEAVMKQFFSGQGSGGGSANAPVFTAAATLSPGSPSAGQSTTFTAKVSDSGGAAYGVNVDMEIYDSSGAQVFQKIFTGQSIGANSSQTYSFDWTPPSAGSYVLKTGVFSGDWSQEYYWGNAVASFGTSDGGNGGAGGTGTTADTIDIWWPSNGASVSGVQPFKAMLKNMSVDDYSMYWQVDGGRLNPMPSNSADYPHKEAEVDVGSWNWRGNGPYVVNFIAEDAGGTVIAQASTTIYN